MPIQNRKISSQFTSPVTKRSSPDSGKVISMKLCMYHVCMEVTTLEKFTVDIDNY
jgi:hypothetical protein